MEQEDKTYQQAKGYYPDALIPVNYIVEAGENSIKAYIDELFVKFYGFY